jgi:PAS domain S-box-containing protein
MARRSTPSKQTIQVQKSQDSQPKQLNDAARDRLAGIVNSAMDAIITIDAAHRIILFNPAAEIMFDYTCEEVLGRHLDSLIPERYRAGHAAYLCAFSETGMTNRKMGALGAISGLRRNGEEFPIEASISQVELDGQTLLTVIMRDISEQQRAAAELRAKDEELRTMSQQLWQAARLATMGELAASIAHELNNPLATITLRIETLLSQSSTHSPQHRALEVVAQEAERMGNLVAHLLQFSRRNQQQISSVDIREEIDKTLELIHYHLRNHNIEIERDFARDIPLVPADRQQLRQLFLNLFTNASDAMLQGGILTVRVGRDDHEVVAEVSDTGTGIAPENLSKVTQPFFTTKEEGKGTGLGLPICRRIVEEHHGRFDIRSREGEGTTVHVNFPMVNADKVDLV